MKIFMLVLKQLVSIAFPMWFAEYDYTCLACKNAFWSYDGTQDKSACKECGSQVILTGEILGRIKYYE